MLKMFEYGEKSQVSKENIWEILWKKNKFYLDDSKLFILARKGKKKFGGKLRFSAGAVVPPPFLHDSILYLFKATAMPNLRAVTRYLVEIL